MYILLCRHFIKQLCIIHEITAVINKRRVLLNQKIEPYWFVIASSVDINLACSSTFTHFEQMHACYSVPRHMTAQGAQYWVRSAAYLGQNLCLLLWGQAGEHCCKHMGNHFLHQGLILVAKIHVFSVLPGFLPLPNFFPVLAIVTLLFVVVK